MREGVFLRGALDLNLGSTDLSHLRSFFLFFQKQLRDRVYKIRIKLGEMTLAESSSAYEVRLCPNYVLENAQMQRDDKQDRERACQRQPRTCSVRRVGGHLEVSPLEPCSRFFPRISNRH